MQTTGRVVFEMFLHERLPAGAPLLPATDTVHSRGFAGRSSASSSDSECSMLYLIDYVSVDCSAHCRSCKHAENCSMRRGSSSETSYTIRALSGYTIPFFTAQNTAMSGFSRDTRWLFNVRDKFVVVVETDSSARSVVSEQFFNDGLPTQHWTAASGELSNTGRG